MDRIAAPGHISRMELTVTVCHDEREGVWYVESSDVPGLNAEAPTYDELVEVIADLAPDLLAANRCGAGVDPELFQRRS